MKKKNKKKNRFVSILLDLILVVALVTAGYSGYKLYDGLKNYHESDVTYEKIRSESKPKDTEESSETEAAGRDWDALRAINPDIAGWISLADSTIDYPVVYANDNSWYLNHMYDNTWNPGGSIFVDYRNNRGFTDRNTVIYGHHMYNDSMFNNVEKYKDASYYESHKVISLETPDGNYELYPIAGNIKKGTDPYTRVEFASEEDYQAYVQSFIDASTFRSDETIGVGDRTVLLSTCSDAVEDGRFALLCKLVKVS